MEVVVAEKEKFQKCLVKVQFANEYLTMGIQVPEYNTIFYAELKNAKIK